MLIRYFRRLLMPTNVSIRRYAIESENRDVIVYDRFAKVDKKDKEAYLAMIKIYENTEKRHRGHVEFIYSALKHMKEFGVHKDLEVYKAILEVFPKGRFVPTNIFQAEFMHYPKQQQCAVDVLDQMEEHGVMPDFEMEDILMSVFGRRGIPLRKFWRMMYWMPKFRNISPWKLPHQLPNDTMDIAKLAIERITSVDADTKVIVYETKEIEASIEDTWIVSGQSPTQRMLLADQPEDEPLTVYGSFIVHLKDIRVTYFTLIGAKRIFKEPDKDTDDVSKLETPSVFSANLPAKVPTVHEQDDGTVLACCATGTSSRDSLLSWIRLLEKHGNPALAKLPVIFTLTAPPTGVAIHETMPATDS